MEKANTGLEKLSSHEGDNYDPFSDEAQEMMKQRAAVATIKRSSHMSQLPAMDDFVTKSKTEKEIVIGDGSDSDEEEKIDTSTGMGNDESLPTDKSDVEEQKVVSFQIPKHSFDRSSGDAMETDEDQEQYHK